MLDNSEALRHEAATLACVAIAGGGRILGLGDQAVVEVLIAPYYRGLPPDGVRHLVDVGAAYGGVASVFLQDGWTADLFEPDPNCQHILAPIIAGHSPRARLFPFAVDGVDRASAQFVQNATPGLSGLAPSPFGVSQATLAVRTVRLDTILAEAGVKRVDFLKIDTEGNDFAVLDAHDFARLSPVLVYVEYSYFFPGQTGDVLARAMESMTRRGYRAIVFEYNDDGNFRRGSWAHRLVAMYFDGVTIPTRAEAFGNILFYRADDVKFLSAVTQTLAALR